MISVAVFDPPEWNLAEVRRYARMTGEDSAAGQLLKECIAEAETVMSYKVCYTAEPIVRSDSTMSIGNIITESATLGKALDGCDSAVVFAATVGTPFDRLITKYSMLSPAKALLLQAIGAERVEALCDAFMLRYAQEHDCRLKPRVSPGYGDMALTMQREVFSMLDCPRKIGLTLNESLLMSPSKSVTAIAGVTSEPTSVNVDKCAFCGNLDCKFRNQRNV